MILLLHPPVAKPSEPPAGIAQLTGTLRGHDIACHAADLNVEALYYLFAHANSGSDTWSKRSFNNLKRNLEMVRQGELYANLPRYQKCVLELNRILEIQGNPETTVSLANFHDDSCSPVCSDDLLRIAREPWKNIFFAFLEHKIPALIDKYQPQYIGISINYLSQAVSSFALLGYLRQIRPDIETIVGGGLITSWMRKPNWNNPFYRYIDHCVDGCGETFLLKFFGKERHRLVPPDYGPFGVGKYFAPGFILPYSCSTGCYWNKCDFCPERAEGNLFSGKNADRVLTEIRILREQHQPTLLHLLDNAVPPAILKQFLKDIPGTPWYGFVRLTHHFLDPDFCLNLRQSGCIMLKIGIESGDQHVLDKMVKGVNLNDVSTALNNLKKAGIGTYVYLLFGTPHENYIAARNTLTFIAKHHNCITFLNLAIFNMPIDNREKISLPLSSFYEGDLSLYTDFDHPSGWTRRSVRSFLDKEFKKHPAIKPIVRRDPAIFTSNHAPFFIPNRQ